MKQVAIVVLAVIGMVVADTEQAGDPYADYYKQYYETHSAQEKSHPHHGSSSTGLSEFATPETALVIGAAGLAAGLLGIAAYVTQNDDVRSICKTTKALGDTSLTRIAATTSVDDDTKRMNEFNKIIDAINGYATPDCSS